MTDLPDWIDIDMEADSNKDVQNQHFIEVFVESTRPFLSRSYVEEEVGLSNEATRLRLGKLVEEGILETTEIAGANIYWLNHPDSEWPVPADVEVAPKNDETTVSELLSSQWVHFSILGGLVLFFGGTLIGIFTFVVTYNVHLPVIQNESLLLWGIYGILGAYIIFTIAIFSWIWQRYKNSEPPNKV